MERSLILNRSQLSGAVGFRRGIVCSFQVVMSLTADYISDMHAPNQYLTEDKQLGGSLPVPNT